MRKKILLLAALLVPTVLASPFAHAGKTETYSITVPQELSKHGNG